MEGVSFGSAVVFLVLVSVMVPEASAARITVGGNKGWSPNVNYTIWAQDKHFYNGDWLLFVYDRNQHHILEVNKTNYETCNSDHPLHNWTTGVGRDVVPLNVTRRYYFLSGNGFCYSGMKMAVQVEKLPPSPKAAPPASKGSAPLAPLHNWTTGVGRDVVPLNVTRRYYFLSGNGCCYSGMKLAMAVRHEKLPPSSKASKGSAPLAPVFRSQFVLPAIFAIGAVWDAFLRFC
ncbi:hypothetical protein ABKV19_026710 [Rosa sericea]